MAECERALFRSTWPCRPVALFGGSRGTAAGPSWSAGPAAASSINPAPAPARTSPPASHPLHIFRELREFAAVELPIPIGVEAHGVFH
jgi:hypothetical protein